jgi:predicted transglutaminase-like cysteine proteinase
MVMRRFLGLFSLLLFSVQHQAFGGDLLPTSRSIGAPAGFASACAKYSWLCRPKGKDTVDGHAAMQLLLQVTRSVNGRISPVNDSKGASNGDVWTLPVTGRGDCEDYALQKMKDLIDAGFPATKLALSVVIGPRNQNHVVLIARLDGTDYVLDNLNNSVKPWRRTPYTYLATQDFKARSAWRVTLAGPRAGEFS